MARTSDLVARWREIGPIEWSESKYGWLMESGAPIVLADWQRAALALWWQHSREITTLAVSLPKKVGKTALTAILLAWRWLCLPSIHFCCASDLDQAQSRQFEMILQMVKRHPFLAAHCRITKSEIEFTPTGSRIVALPADFAGAAGANFATSAHTEAWAVVHEGSRRLFEELTPTPLRVFDFPCLRLVDSYAGIEVESELWNGIVDRGLAGDRVPGAWPCWIEGQLMLFHMEGAEAQERCWIGATEERRDYYNEQAQTLRPGTYARLHENRRAAGESVFITHDAWESCRADDIRLWSPGDKRQMVLAVDASTSKDSSAIVGCWWNPERKRVEVIFYRLWIPKVIHTDSGQFRGGRPSIDLEDLRDEVLRLHKLGAVREVCFDPYQLALASQEWHAAGVACREIPQNQGRVETDTHLYDLIQTRRLAHNGDKLLTDHVLAASAKETSSGFRITKDKLSKKIDLCVALSMAAHGAAIGQRNSTWVGITVIGGLLADRPRIGYRHIEPGARKPLTTWEWEKRSEQARERERESLSCHYAAQQARQ